MSTQNVIILGDTNTAYILYFFASAGLISKSNIVIDNQKLEFHPIVQKEVDAHRCAWAMLKECNIKSDEIPDFFDTVGDQVISNIQNFVDHNLSTVSPVNIQSRSYVDKRKIYENIRNRLQSKWIQSGTKGRKVISTPSNSDYSILYSAELSGHKLTTNDEILLAIAEEILDPINAFKAEKILNSLYKQDPGQREAIQDVINTLGSFNRLLVTDLIFSN